MDLTAHILPPPPSVIPETPGELKKAPTAVTSDLQNQILDLLSRLLVWNPEKRLTATEMLAHRFFGVCCVCDVCV